MLETVSKGFRSARNLLSGKAELTESNTDEALREVRLSLLEADVEFGVVKGFLARVREKALGGTVATEATNKKGQKLKVGPAEHFIKSCYEELEALMGPVDSSLRVSKPVGTIMMVGLQGTGKTTTTGKLAMYLKAKGHRPMLVAADIYRPAAIEQLKVVGAQAGVKVYTEEGVAPPELCLRAMQKAKEWQCDLCIFDTAGRLSIDDDLMNELGAIKDNTKPDNIMLVVDAMMGQDAVRTAVEFDNKLSIDGFIMTKLDGDARGGAALSIKEITGQPIKFLGTGEKLDALEEFRPDGLASRILGMGDVVGLVQDFEQHVDTDKAEKDAMRMLQGKFTLQDFLDQLKTLKKMGSVSSLLEKLPGMSDMIPEGTNVDDGEFTKLEAMVLSMTKQERSKPDLVASNKSRKKRIANGSGRTVKEVDDLLQRFSTMKQMMQMIGMQPNMLSRIPGFGNMAKMAQMGGGGAGDMSAMFGGMNPFGAAGGRPIAPPAGYYSTTRTGAAGGKADKKAKAKRAAQKKARKKGRKKK